VAAPASSPSWKDSGDEAVLIECYTLNRDHGASLAAERLPHRTAAAISLRAKELGLVKPRGKGARDEEPAREIRAELDAGLREIWRRRLLVHAAAFAAEVQAPQSAVIEATRAIVRADFRPVGHYARGGVDIEAVG
jgi:hypothetical protein